MGILKPINLSDSKLANHPPELRTDRILARPYTPADEQEFIGYMTDPEVNYYMDDNVLSREEAEELFEKVQHIYNHHPGKKFYIWAIEFRGKCAGHLELKQTENTVAGELEVVYMLNRKYWGKGIMTELLAEVVHFAAGEGYSVIATLDRGNGRSLRLLERMGVETVIRSWGKDDRVIKVILKKRLKGNGQSAS